MNFTGINEKLKRADENIRNLYTEVTAFIQECEYPVMPKIESEEHNKAVAYFKKLRIPLRFSVLGGEVVHHLREFDKHGDNVHFVDQPQRISGRGDSVIRLEFLDELERTDVRHSLYFSVIFGTFVFRRWPRLKNGEFEGCTSFGGYRSEICQGGKLSRLSHCSRSL
jgi:hypothetical protein